MLPGRYSYSGRASKSISGNFYWLKMALAIASGLFTYSTLTTERCPHSRRCVSKSVMPKTRLQNEHFPIGFEHSTDSWRIWSYLKIRIPHPSQTTYMKLQSSNSCVPSNNSSYVSWYMQRALLHLNLIWLRYSYFSLFNCFNPVLSGHLQGVEYILAESEACHCLMQGAQKLPSQFSHSCPCTITQLQKVHFSASTRLLRPSKLRPFSSRRGLIPCKKLNGE